MAKSIEKRNARQARYYIAHREQILARSAKYRKENRQKVNACIAKSRQKNPTKRSENKARYRAIRLGIVPILTKQERKRIREIYRERNFLTESTGIQHHVDHVIPLSRGGTHHPDNLRVITATENIKKGCRILTDLVAAYPTGR